ncbi:hypothetical protein LOK49_LG15G00614 [Camellia lanceoleosa]|uniref:Uncharacterized protein n=1 Tax=Camellia lanceoleosa TaxID=1840588 RepID=A0ACC0F5D8_9ERIC|nr:hypothetical protein LOK49_LG15G00614 [Camellia lanceoleosa]
MDYFFPKAVSKVANMMVLVMFLILVTTKPVEAGARPFHGRKLTVAHGGGGRGHRGRDLVAAPPRKEAKPPPGPSSCTFLPINDPRHC